MNLIWHIIKKDFRRFRWELALWAVAGIYARLGWRADFEIAEGRDVIVVIATIAWAVLSMALIIGVVQEDNLVDTKAHWRTRPIRPGSLLLAKLGFIGMFFVGLPLTFFWQADCFGVTRHYPGWGSAYINCMIVSVPLSFAGLAACTQNSLHAFITWLGVLLMVFLLSAGIEILLPRPEMLTRMAAEQLIPAKGILIMATYTMISVLILLNQYLHQQRKVSLLLLAAGAVCSVLIGEFWRWNFLS